MEEKGKHWERESRMYRTSSQGISGNRDATMYVPIFVDGFCVFFGVSRDKSAFTTFHI